ncbi:glycerophosphodiester phosphodiesterase [Nocardiopsis synnemataformans]|uniref:glycerophosphodiester phosphodiesterase n=1 Tax=Nocardiopsis synnemataformans TaxID=61305 RepID=UPI003EB7A1AA
MTFNPCGPGPVVIAHRGASAIAPENTLAALSMAITLGAPLVEVDVQLGVDGTLICVHDTTLARTHGVDLPVADMTVADAATLMVQPHLFGHPAWGPQPTPTLDRVFAEFGRAPVTWLVEAKAPSGTDAAEWARIGEAIVACARRWGVASRTIVSGFHREPGYAAIRNGIPACFNATRGADDPYVLSQEGFSYYGMRLDADEDNIAAAHAVGLKVLPYTVNRHVDRDRLAALGVWGIVTDQPWYLSRDYQPAPGPVYTTPAWPHGHLPSPVTPVDGQVDGGGLVLASPSLAAGDADNYTAVIAGAVSGWSAAHARQVCVDVDVELLAAGGPSRSAQIHLAETDIGYDDNHHGRVDAYNVLVRADGELALWAAVDGAAIELATAQGPPLAVSETAPARVSLQLRVNGPRVEVTRTDTSPPVTVATDNEQVQPRYVGLGVRAAKARFLDLRLR